MIRAVFKDVVGVDLADPFPRMTYEEAMRRYGSDKPDLRIALELVDVAEKVKNVEFKVFAEAANRRRRPRRGAASARRRRAHAQADRRARRVRRQIRRQGSGLDPRRRPRERPRRHSTRRSRNSSTMRRSPPCSTRSERQTGDMVFFGAGTYKSVSDFMGALRIKVARDRGLVASKLDAALGHRFPDVRVRRTKQNATSPCITRSPRRKSTTSPI